MKMFFLQCVVVIAVSLAVPVISPDSQALAQGVELNIGTEAKSGDQPLPGGEHYYTSIDGEGTDHKSAFSFLMLKVLRNVCVIGMLAAFGYLIWGGVDWIVSGGEKGKIEKARDKITHAVVGVIVLSAAIAIFQMLQFWAGTTVIDFNGSGAPPISGGGGGASGPGGTGPE